MSVASDPSGSLAQFHVADSGVRTKHFSMPLKILIAPDKFKGTLTAQQAAEAIAHGWRSVRPDDALELLPMSDGGDGFGEIISQLLGATSQSTPTVNAAGESIQGPWWWHEPSLTAIVESARVIGLAMLPRDRFHPHDLDTRGLGEILQAAARRGARRCIVGIGGSATNDGGFGLARALGWQFLNRHDEDITRWIDLPSLANIRPPQTTRLFTEIIVAVDVQNPLLGPNGCSRVYGPQKGLTDFDIADRALGRLAEVAAASLRIDHTNTPGAGAAGGLGFGLMTFCGARMEPGIDIFERHSELTRRVKSSDLVLTGEGALDAQTLMGKGVGEIATVCQREGVPCIGMAGVVPEPEKAKTKFTAAYALTPGLTDKQSALNEPAAWLERLAAKVAVDWRG